MFVHRILLTLITLILNSHIVKPHSHPLLTMFFKFVSYHLGCLGLKYRTLNRVCDQMFGDGFFIYPSGSYRQLAFKLGVRRKSKVSGMVELI